MTLKHEEAREAPGKTEAGEVAENTLLAVADWLRDLEAACRTAAAAPELRAGARPGGPEAYGLARRLLDDAWKKAEAAPPPPAPPPPPPPRVSAPNRRSRAPLQEPEALTPEACRKLMAGVTKLSFTAQYWMEDSSRYAIRRIYESGPGKNEPVLAGVEVHSVQDTHRKKHVFPVVFLRWLQLSGPVHVVELIAARWASEECTRSPRNLFWGYVTMLKRIQVLTQATNFKKGVPFGREGSWLNAWAFDFSGAEGAAFEGVSEACPEIPEEFYGFYETFFPAASGDYKNHFHR